jgi:hypothetical protein
MQLKRLRDSAVVIWDCQDDQILAGLVSIRRLPQVTGALITENSRSGGTRAAEAMCLTLNPAGSSRRRLLLSTRP